MSDSLNFNVSSSDCKGVLHVYSSLHSVQLNLSNRPQTIRLGVARGADVVNLRLFSNQVGDDGLTTTGLVACADFIASEQPSPPTRIALLDVANEPEGWLDLQFLNKVRYAAAGPDIQRYWNTKSDEIETTFNDLNLNNRDNVETMLSVKQFMQGSWSRLPVRLVAWIDQTRARASKIDVFAMNRLAEIAQANARTDEDMLTQFLQLPCLTTPYRADVTPHGNPSDQWTNPLDWPATGALPGIDCEDGTRMAFCLMHALRSVTSPDASLLLQSLCRISQSYTPYFTVVQLKTRGSQMLLHLMLTLLCTDGSGRMPITVEPTAWASARWSDTTTVSPDVHPPDDLGCVRFTAREVMDEGMYGNVYALIDSKSHIVLRDSDNNFGVPFFAFLLDKPAKQKQCMVVVDDSPLEQRSATELLKHYARLDFHWIEPPDKTLPRYSQSYTRNITKQYKSGCIVDTGLFGGNGKIQFVA